MGQMWREGSLTDCEVRVEGRVFTAHRIVLAACSTFMRAAFTVGLAETATASVVLEEVDPAVFEAVLEFCYAGECTFDESLSLTVLQVASRLGIEPLETQVVAHITKRIDPAMCLTLNYPESWLAVDLGEGRSLVVDHYCLRSDLNNRHKLRNWELQGSLNGQTWQTLRAHQGDESLASQSMSTAAWPVNAGAQAFRHFRILQTGANSSGIHYLKCTGIELYGRSDALTFSRMPERAGI